MIAMSNHNGQELNAAYQNLAQAVKALNAAKFEKTQADQILQQWQKLAKLTALNANIPSLKLLLSLLRTLTPIYPEWEIYLHYYVGMLALIEGLYAPATSYFEKELAEARRQQNPALEVQAKIALAEALLPQTRYAEVEILLKEAFETSHREHFYLHYIRALNRVARLCHYRRRWEFGQRYLEQVQELIKTYPDPQDKENNKIELELEEAFTNHWLGSILMSERKWQEAAVLLESSLNVRSHYRDLLGVVETMLKLGATYQQLGQQDKALTCFEGSLAICQQIHCLPLSLQAYYYKATTYFSLGRYKEALSPAKTALDIGLKLKQNDWLARAYYILGRICEKLDDTKNSIICHLEAAKLYQPTDDNPQWIELLIGIGDFLLAVRDRPDYWELALKSYKHAINLIESNQQLEYLAPAMGKIARAFLKIDALDGVDEAARCYRLQLRLAGDLESTVLPVSVAVALRVEALTGIQCCASLKINPNFNDALEKLERATPVLDLHTPFVA